MLSDRDRDPEPDPGPGASLPGQMEPLSPRPGTAGLAGPAATAGTAGTGGAGAPFESLRAIERAHIQRVLDGVSWNKKRAAQVLDIGRETLYRKIAEFGLTPSTVLDGTVRSRP